MAAAARESAAWREVAISHRIGYRIRDEDARVLADVVEYDGELLKEGDFWGTGEIRRRVLRVTPVRGEEDVYDVWTEPDPE
jgi:hypothetical protein